MNVRTMLPRSVRWASFQTKTLTPVLPTLLLTLIPGSACVVTLLIILDLRRTHTHTRTTIANQKVAMCPVPCRSEVRCGSPVVCLVTLFDIIVLLAQWT